MKKITIIFIALCAISLASCKDFLDVKPTNQVSSDASISTPSDAGVLMNAIMRMMCNGAYYGRTFIMYGDAKGGDLAIESQGRGLSDLYAFNHYATSGSYSDFWTYLYNITMQLNTVILNIDKMVAAGNTTAVLKNYQAQALSLRAMVYFDLVRLYGKPYTMDKASYGVPLVLEPLDASAQPTRASVEAVYTQILKDLKDAESLFTAKAKSNGYMNYFANMALQAKVNLYMGNYAAALAAAETVINSGVYTLYANAGWVNSWKSQYGSESIFELAMNAGEADLTTGSLGIYLRTANHGSSAATSQYIISDFYINRLKQDPTDVRFGILTNDRHVQFVPEGRPFGSCYKYSGGLNLEGDGKGNSTAVNIKVIRLSDVVLMAAEAALGANNKDKAASYLNMIRKRAPGLAEATAANVTIDMILDERSKELLCEGHRFFDMMRLNKTVVLNDELIFPSVVIVHRGKTVDRTFPKAILPIPKGEIDANPPIGAQQNPGY